MAHAAEIGLQSMGDAAKKAEIAFFGGSFTAIEPAYMQRLLSAAFPYVRDGRYRGIRVSTRPDAVDAPILRLLKEYGVTAVELGAQSMDRRVLDFNRRGHSPEDVERASELIKAADISLGLQMMTGLYGDTKDGAIDTARKLAVLAPDTMRIYPTIVMKKTRLEELYRAGAYVPMGLEDTVDLCAALLDFFEEKQIKVIRLGLHGGAEMEASRVAGPWHPAFGELCESRRYFNRAYEMLRRELPLGGTAELLVHPSSLSQMIGQKKANIAALADMGYQVKIMPCNHREPGQIVLKNCHGLS